MNSFCLDSFWEMYEKLPPEIQQLAKKNYRFWLENPSHPSLHFKHISDGMWSVRVGRTYRAMGYREGDTVTWSWIGHHDAYKEFIKSL